MTEVDATQAAVAGLRRETAVVTVCTLLSRITGFGRVLATIAVLGGGVLGDPGERLGGVDVVVHHPVITPPVVRSYGAQVGSLVVA